MTRRLYALILCLHPPGFRSRFRDEMLSIFDEGASSSGFALLLDGFHSLARQWLLRTDSWKFLIAISGAYIQIWGFALPARGHQSWAENHQAITPYMQQVILLTLALIASIFVMTMSLTIWIVRFQGRRSRNCTRSASCRLLARLPNTRVIACSKFGD